MPGNRHTQLAAWRAVRQRIGAEPLTRRRISLWLQGSLFFTANGSYFVFWGLRRSCRQDWELRHRAAAKTRLEQRPMTEGLRRDAS